MESLFHTASLNLIKGPEKKKTEILAKKINRLQG